MNTPEDNLRAPLPAEKLREIPLLGIYPDASFGRRSRRWGVYEWGLVANAVTLAAVLTIVIATSAPAASSGTAESPKISPTIQSLQTERAMIAASDRQILERYRRKDQMMIGKDGEQFMGGKSVRLTVKEPSDCPEVVVAPQAGVYQNPHFDSPRIEKFFLTEGGLVPGCTIVEVTDLQSSTSNTFVVLPYSEEPGHLQYGFTPVSQPVSPSK